MVFSKSSKFLSFLDTTKSKERREYKLLKKLYGLKGLGPYFIEQGTTNFVGEYDPTKCRFFTLTGVPISMSLTRKEFNFLVDRGLLRFDWEEKYNRRNRIFEASLSELGKIKMTQIATEINNLLSIYQEDN